MKLIANPKQTIIDLGYETNYSVVDMYYLSNKYGSLTLQDCFVNETQIDYEWLNVVVSGVLIANDYKYKKLKQTIDYDYSYDKNYNRTKNVQITNTYGTQTTTTSNGAQTTTNNYGAQSGNVTNKRNAFDNDITNLATDNTSESNTTAYSDSTNVSEKTDNETRQGYEDSFVTHEEEFGDLSVRTVADIIKSEREIAEFSIYDIIYKDIIKEIAIYIFE